MLRRVHEIQSETNSNLNIGRIECPICLQTAVHPTKLPCGHIFCFLCLKGVVISSHKCALCRRETSNESINNPQLIYGDNSVRNIKPFEDGYQWFYKGRGGWWQYDENTSIEIEKAYKSNNKTCTIFVAGLNFIVDFETMMQRRQNYLGKKRCVKRDLAIGPKKGVAGIRFNGNISARNGISNSIAVVNQIENSTETINTPPGTSYPTPYSSQNISTPSTPNSFLQNLQHFRNFTHNTFRNLTTRSSNYRGQNIINQQEHLNRQQQS